MTDDDAEDKLEQIRKLTKDLKAASRTLSQREARYLVDYYYVLQNHRIRAEKQEADFEKSGEPHVVISWLSDSVMTLEKEVTKALDAFSSSSRTGRWARSVHGIGPVIAAGLMAHIDPAIAITAGRVWRFAGLDPTVKWEKGQKRPWNARLKVLMWKIGESFVKFSGSEKCFYGHLYRQRKAIEVAKNDAFEFRATAEADLKARKFKKEVKEIYETGKLPAGRIDLRARRWAVKIFAAHYQTVAYEVHHGKKAPRPWVIEHGGHVEEIVPPGWPCE